MFEAGTGFDEGKGEDFYVMQEGEGAAVQERKEKRDKKIFGFEILS